MSGVASQQDAERRGKRNVAYWSDCPASPWRIHVHVRDQLLPNTSIPSAAYRACTSRCGGGIAPVPGVASTSALQLPVQRWEPPSSRSWLQGSSRKRIWLWSPSIISGVGFLIRFVLNGQDGYFSKKSVVCVLHTLYLSQAPSSCGQAVFCFSTPAALFTCLDSEA